MPKTPSNTPANKPDRQPAADAGSNIVPLTSPGAAREADTAGLDVIPPELCEPSPFQGDNRFSIETADRAFRAHLAHFTMGVTPFGLSTIIMKWWLHLSGSPGKQVMLAETALRDALELMVYAGTLARDPQAQHCIRPVPQDKRFADPAWQRFPYNLMHQSFLLWQRWWHNTTNDIHGLSRREELVVSFIARQMLDIVSPSNFVWTNPEIADTTLREGGANLYRGFQNFLEDFERTLAGAPPRGAENFVPGRDVATTPGKVVYRNDLIELIQYEPATDRVTGEPILIVPAWIMKYYILDLSPHNSLVRYLVEQGFTVFIISWRNPGTEHRDLGMPAYLNDGVFAALDAVRAIVPERKVHATGYCIGGTLLAIAAAAMARDGDDRLQTVTLFATQTDFSEPGELDLFISDSEVSFLEDMMWDQGYLDTKQMAGAFQLLRSNDLIWSRYVHEYLRGGRQPMFDLMAWNADATRLPYKMHSEYLRHLFLNNELAQGRYEVDGQPVAVSDINAPVFSVSTESDHVAPWQSVYKLHLIADTEITFVLTTGGHNAGIVSEPGRSGRRFQIRTMQESDRYLPPETWRQEAESREGSWWPAWTEWLRARSAADSVAPPPMGGKGRDYRPRIAAPGSYVYQR